MEKGQSVFGGSASQPEANSVPGNAGANERVSASLDNWKRKLLDLTKRNRALNFRMNKVSTIAIVDEQPAEVFRQLYIQEGAMRFKAAPDKDEQIDLLANEQASETEDSTEPLEVATNIDNPSSA